ncbi:MAG: hypothetical protein U9N50_10600 [Pseudomonadota bacterium]|nr:hypothetical protein [Pseudomonadota bacterium]
MNSICPLPPYNLLALYKDPAVNHISGFRNITEQIELDELIAAYHRMREIAPKRHERKKAYFVDHTGFTSSGAYSNRREEHLAIALWNSSKDDGHLQLPNGQPLSLLDYQFPLKAQQGDKGVGKVDLFGVVDGIQPSVIELKIDPATSGRSDTPLRAFLEALAYCAIIEANFDDIAFEASEKMGVDIANNRIALILIAPELYWSKYIHYPRAGDWLPALQNLADQVSSSLKLDTHFLSLHDSTFKMGLDGESPRLVNGCSLKSVANLI